MVVAKMLSFRGSEVDVSNNIFKLLLTTTYSEITIEIPEYNISQSFEVNRETNEVDVAISLDYINLAINIKAEERLIIPFKIYTLTPKVIDFINVNMYDIKRNSELIRTFNKIRVTENYPFEQNHYDDGFYDGVILGQMI